MKLARLLSPDRIVDLKAAGKDEALRELSDLLSTSRNVTDPKAFQKAVTQREAILSTGIGLGLAVPHAKLATVKNFAVAVGRSKAGIDWDSLDGAPVHVVVMIAANEAQTTDYTKLLAEIVSRIKPEDVRRKILAAAGPKDILSLLSD